MRIAFQPRLAGAPGVLCLMAGLVGLLFYSAVPPVRSLQGTPAAVTGAVAVQAGAGEVDRNREFFLESVRLDADTSEEDLLSATRDAVLDSLPRAWVWADSQSNPVLRERLCGLVVRAWGENDPQGAVSWALAQDEGVRLRLMEAALTGAAAQPATALAIGQRLLADDPVTGSAYGSVLVGALAGAGQFQSALQFASRGPADTGADWMTSVFRRWGEAQPDEAVRAWEKITQVELRTPAFRALVDGWEARDPSALVAYAVALPASEERSFALEQGLQRWSVQDPSAMAAWLNRLGPSTEFDFGVTTMLSRTDGANRDTKTAAAWVACIGDPELRYVALSRLAREWAEEDRVAFRNYVEAVSWLNVDQRQHLLQSFKERPQAGLSFDAE
jgi:hypothetical protein